MGHRSHPTLLGIAIAVASFLPTGAIGQTHPAQASHSLDQSQPMLSRPVFIENKGQWDKRAKFLLRSPGLDLWITDNGVLYDLQRVDEQVEPKGPRLSSAARHEGPIGREVPEVTVRRTPVFITYEGASSEAIAVGTGKLPEYHNYYIGNDPTKWAEHVPLYRDARVQGLYKGIDAVFYLDAGRPRYDLVVAPGADPSKIWMKVEGATDVSVTSSGALRMTTALGIIEQRGMYAYQEVGGMKQQVACAFVVGTDGSARLNIGEYDRTRPLVIDPLVWSTYLGGSGADRGVDIAVDGSGNAYVTGYTASSDFPTLNALQPSFAGGTIGNGDAFVTKLTSNGIRSYSTYLGGSHDDRGYGIAVDGSGNAYVTGYTKSTDFPIVNASQSSNAGGSDAFVTKLTSSGTRSYSTYLGGLSSDAGNGIAVDGSGNAYVIGSTTSNDFPTLNASQPGYAGGLYGDAFVTKLTSSGARSYSTYLGGSNTDGGVKIAVDASGNAYAAGETGSSDFPTLNASQSFTGDRDVFVTKLTSGGSRSYSTYLGGSGYDVGHGIAIDVGGNAYVTGFTESTDFPTLNASQPSFAGGRDAFVTKLTPSGTRSYSTYLGGSGEELGFDIGVDGSGNTYVTGRVASEDFPTLNASQPSFAGGLFDGFVMKLTSSGTRSYSTYLGGSGWDEGDGVAIDGSGNAYVTGYTKSTDFPIVNSSQSSNGGRDDAFITKIGDSPGPNILVIQPLAGEVWIAGEPDTLKWAGPTGIDLHIEFSNDGGASYIEVANHVPSGDYQYIWHAPEDLSMSPRCKLKLSNTADPDQVWTSDIFRYKGYVLTRIGADGYYEKFELGKHAWSFDNRQESDFMWPKPWWNQFQYISPTVVDPNTGTPYSSRIGAFPVSGQPQDFPDWPRLFVGTFGTKACYESLVESVPTARALEWWAAVKGEWRGSCFGFASSSLQAFLFPSEFFGKFNGLTQTGTIHSLPFSADARSAVNQVQTGVFGLLWQLNADIKYVNITPNQTLHDLRVVLLSDNPDYVGCLTMVDQASPSKGAHSVVPFEIRHDDINPALFQVYVYDSNRPESEWIVEIDTSSNTWTEYLSSVRITGGGAGLYVDLPAATFLDEQWLPATIAGRSVGPSTMGAMEQLDSTLRISTPRDADAIIVSQRGDSAGTIDGGAINAMAGAVPIIPPTGYPHPPIAFNVPNGTYSARVTRFRNPIGRFGVFTDSTVLTYGRSDADSTDTDLVTYDGGLGIRNPDNRSKLSNFQVILTEPNAEKTFTLLDASMRANDSMRVDLHQEDRLRVLNAGSGKTYALRLRHLSSSGEVEFLHRDVPLDSNAVHIINARWDSLADHLVEVYVDLSNDGTIDDTLLLRDVLSSVREVEFSSASEHAPAVILDQNYPNPFNPSTTVSYTIGETSPVVLRIYNGLGVEVATLVNEVQSAGKHQATFRPEGLESGVYSCELRVAGYVQTRTMVLLK